MPLAMALPVAAAAAVLMDLAYPEVGFWPAAFAATGLLLLVKSRGVVSFRCFLGWVVVRR